MMVSCRLEVVLKFALCSMEGTQQAAMYRTQQQRLLAVLDAMKGELVLMSAHLQVRGRRACDHNSNGRARSCRVA